MTDLNFLLTVVNNMRPCMTDLNFLLTVVHNMRPAVNDESVRYSVYICFKVNNLRPAVNDESVRYSVYICFKVNNMRPAVNDESVRYSVYISQCPTVTLEERSKRRNFGRITPNFGLFQWIRRHFWCFD